MIKISEKAERDYRLKWLSYFTYSLLYICVFSGIIITLDYNIKDPFNSISNWLLVNLEMALFRSVHFWSAHLLLISSIFHIIDHLFKSSENKIKFKLWVLICMIIPVSLFLMLTGFFLKGDAESNQALLILRNIIANRSDLREMLSTLLTGNGNNLNVIFLHHISTATIITTILTAFHAKTFFPGYKHFIYSLSGILILSLIFIPGLNNSQTNSPKGPWYFIGLQELLYHFSNPDYITISLFLSFLFLMILPKLSGKLSGRIKAGFFILFLGYFILSVVGIFFRGENWQLKRPDMASMPDIFQNYFRIKDIPDSLSIKKIPLVSGQPEGCLVCHAGVKGLNPSHNPEALGCSGCHLGNSFSLKKEIAHEGIILIPGNLATSRITCGKSGCHDEIEKRVQNSLMTNLSGIVSVDKYVFGEVSSPDNYFHIKKIGGSQADIHLRNLCSTCHLGNSKDYPDTINESSRGGGCTACHLQYDEKSKEELINNYFNGIKKTTRYHPSISIESNNKYCFGCHSRSGRIATNYEGFFETTLPPSGTFDTVNYRILERERVFQKFKPDIHFEYGMSCIDCHISTEIMGDGKSYYHKEDQVKIQCEDCHIEKIPKTKAFSEMDSESKKILRFRKLDSKKYRFALSERWQKPLLNVILLENKLYLLKKSESENRTETKPIHIKEPSENCSKNIAGHKTLTCVSCHTRWVPSCINCHTEFIKNKTSYDNLTQEDITGGFFEKGDNFSYSLPVLGKKKYGDSEKTSTFLPGMILDLSFIKNGQKEKIFTRLFAPGFSHTISKKGLGCVDCHTNPQMLGFGSGKLEFYTDGNKKIKFLPSNPVSVTDGIPSDGWIKFMSTDNGNSTRTTTRSFNITEQKRILNVGGCLSCHNPKESRMVLVFRDFGNYKKYLSKKCISLI